METEHHHQINCDEAYLKYLHGDGEYGGIDSTHVVVGAGEDLFHGNPGNSRGS